MECGRLEGKPVEEWLGVPEGNPLDAVATLVTPEELAAGAARATSEGVLAGFSGPGGTMLTSASDEGGEGDELEEVHHLWVVSGGSLERGLSMTWKVDEERVEENEGGLSEVLYALLGAPFRDLRRGVVNAVASCMAPPSAQ